MSSPLGILSEMISKVNKGQTIFWPSNFEKDDYDEIYFDKNFIRLFFSQAKEVCGKTPSQIFKDNLNSSWSNCTCPFCSVARAIEGENESTTENG